MKVKKYQVTLTSPEEIHVITFQSYNEVNFLFGALDELWRYADLELWSLEITPFWEEVPDDA